MRKEGECNQIKLTARTQNRHERLSSIPWPKYEGNLTRQLEPNTNSCWVPGKKKGFERYGQLRFWSQWPDCRMSLRYEDTQASLSSRLCINDPCRALDLRSRRSPVGQHGHEPGMLCVNPRHHVAAEHVRIGF